MSAFLKALMKRFKPVVVEYISEQLQDLETELAIKWSTTGVPMSIKQITADVKEAVLYVLTHGPRGG